jgi:hypothetical protein
VNDNPDVGGALRGLPSFFLAQFDELADQRIREVGRTLRIRRFVGYLQQARVAGCAHRQIALDLPHQFVALRKTRGVGELKHAVDAPRKSLQSGFWLLILQLQFVNHVFQ